MVVGQPGKLVPVYAGCEFESHPRRLKKPVHLNRFFCYTSHDLKLCLETLGLYRLQLHHMRAYMNRMRRKCCFDSDGTDRMFDIDMWIMNPSL